MTDLGLGEMELNVREWRARNRVSGLTLALVWLAVSFPFLTFPEVVWPWGRPVVVTIAVISLVVAVRLAIGLRVVGYFVSVLSLTLFVGWALAADRQTALTHFAGAALGLLSMVTVALYGSTSTRLLRAATLFLVLGFSALLIGLTGTQNLTNKMAFLDLIQQLPALSVYVPGLESSPHLGMVNPNALGGTALLIVPFGIALMFLPRSEVRGHLVCRALGLLTTVLGALIIVATQSRMVWIASWLVVFVASVRLVPPGKWRLLVSAFVLVLPMTLLVWFGGGTLADQIDRPIDLVVSTVEVQSVDENATILDRVLRAGQRTLTDRSNVWRQGVDQVRTSPWFGIGLNEFRHVIQPGPDGRSEAHAHNIFLQTTLDVGFVGLFAYVSLLLYLLVRADQAVRGPALSAGRIGAAAGLSLAAAHFFGMADAIALGARVGLFQWLASGLILASWQTQRSTAS